MNRLVWMGLLAFLVPPMAIGADPARTPKSLVICLDGMRADGLEAGDTSRVHALIDGRWQPGYHCAYACYAQAIKDVTTGSGPNTTTIFTGVTSAAHHVGGNVDAQMAAVTYPDYFARLQQANPRLSTAPPSPAGPCTPQFVADGRYELDVNGLRVPAVSHGKCPVDPAQAKILA